MRRINWKTVSTLVTTILLAGCAESVVSPRATPVSTSAASVLLAPEGRPLASLNHFAAGNTETDFVVGPQGGTFAVGRNAVVFPARAICDPALSSYGPEVWDQRCRPLNRSITIHAVTRVTADGRTQVDFSPALRFVPSSNPARWVWLYMNVPSLAGSTDLSLYTIYYAPTLDGPLVDESLTDPTLRTYVDPGMGVSLRRVKHFSGYSVLSQKCEPSDPNDPSSPQTCVNEPPPPSGETQP